MTAGSVAAAIDDARALLDTLVANGWRDAHVVCGDTEIFIARDGGQPNPLRQAVAASLHDEVQRPLVEVKSPHVATLVDTAPIGTRVVAGQAIATIRVLGEDETIAAPSGGEIAAISATVGALLEFGTPVLSLGPDA